MYKAKGVGTVDLCVICLECRLFV